MIPMRHSTIFKSRWMALVWAAGILWGAYDVASAQPQAGDATDNNAAASNDAADQPTDATGAAITPEQAQQLNDALNAF